MLEIAKKDIFPQTLKYVDFLANNISKISSLSFMENTVDAAFSLKNAEEMHL